MTKTEIEEKKSLIRILAKQIGLVDYEITFLSKNSKLNHNKSTLEGIVIVEYWIDRVFVKTGIDLKTKTRKMKMVMYRNSLINILYNVLKVPKLAISEGLEMNHTTILHSINESNKWLDVQDQQFMPYYKEIEKIINN